jgi:hypothetical protein
MIIPVSCEHPQEALSLHPGGIGAFGVKQHPQRDGSLLPLFGLAQNSPLPFGLQTKSDVLPPHWNAVGQPVGATTSGSVKVVGKALGAKVGGLGGEMGEPKKMGPALGEEIETLLTQGLADGS